MKLRAFAFASLALAASTSGCSSTDEADDELASNEDELSAPCQLGATCGASVKLLDERSYLSGRPPANTRADVEVAVSDPGHDRTPRRFSQKTSRPMTFAGGAALLTGSADGTSPIVVDDILLFEVLDGQGRLLDAAVLTNGPAVKLSGNTLRALAPTPAFAGANKGWPYAAGTVDLASLLPRGKTFRLRVSALDYAGVALVSDVFVRPAAAAPPPPPPPPPPAVDPFNPASCSGAPMTQAQMVSRFPAGGTHASIASNVTVRTRVRTCNRTTGCGPWTATDKLPYRFTWSDPRQGAMTSTHFVSLPETGSDAGVRFELRDGGRLYVDVYASHAGKGFVVAKKLFGPTDWSAQTHAGDCVGAFCGNVHYPYSGAGYGGHADRLSSGVVTNECFLLGGSTSVTVNERLGTTEEYETKIYGTL